MKMKRINFKQIFSITVTVLLLVAHVAIVLIGIKSFRYYDIYPELFNYIFGLVICLFIIIDIVFIIGTRHKDLVQKIIVCVMAVLLSIGGLYGTMVMNKTDEVVNNVFEDENEEQYETISGLFVTYSDDYKEIKEISDLKKIEELKVGSLVETSEEGITSVGLKQLEDAGITDYNYKGYTNNTDLLFALIGNEIDVAIFSNAYKAVFRADENVDYTQYLDQTNEFGEFSKDIVVQSNTSTKDLSKDPFNVLLIGWSPIIGSDTIGLADAIIVATVNPQTYTVSMMSIARDSYVPISCYGGECDKINSGRGTSMDCFVSTVENLIQEEIDFYMEINFWGFAVLVDCIGGVEINNPVSFELDGTFVPEGNYVADGWQALQFARERHHMPNGDFDRQQHQKEVIMQIAKKFLKHDLAFALDVFNEVSQFINTNLTLKQLSGVFNMLKATKNYTGLSLFNILDMHALRITGYADWHYNDDYELPLWIYRLYQGSIDESLEHMQGIMGNYKNVNQNSGFSFDVNEPYVREPFFSLSYDEKEEHEVLPPYYPNLSSMTYEDALIWATNSGATLVPTFISPGDEKYDEALDGMIIYQSIAYGKRVSKYPTCNITVMGNGSVLPKLPDSYEGWSLDQAKAWCDNKNYKHDSYPYYVVAGTKDNKEVYKMEIIDDVIAIYYYAYAPENSTVTDGKFTCNDGYTYDSKKGICKLTIATVPNWANKESPAEYQSESIEVEGITYLLVYENHATIKKNHVISQNPKAGSTIDLTKDKVTLTISKGPVCKHTHKTETFRVDATCTKEGSITYTCDDCGETVTEEITKLEHTWSTTEYIAGEIVAPTCETDGYTKYYKKCSVCGAKGEYDHDGDTVTKLGHEYGEWQDNEDGTWTRYCIHEGCSSSESTDQNPS